MRTWFGKQALDQGKANFTKLTGLFKNLNYAAEGSPDRESYRKQIDDLAKSVPSSAPGTPEAAWRGAATVRVRSLP